MKPRKILLATAPFDGHFNPLTSIAMHLQSQGHEVRWYAGGSYAPKLRKLNIPHFTFRRATEVNQENMDTVYPQRARVKGAIKRLKFDIKHLFLVNTQSYFEDLQEIYWEQFAFDCLICDLAFVSAQLVKEKLGIPVYVVGVAPLSETSREVAPHGTGLTPASSMAGKLLLRLLQRIMHTLVLKESVDYYNSIITAYGLPPATASIFDLPSQVGTLYLQSGVPGFEYSRSDMSSKVRFIGPLLPYKQTISHEFKHQAKLGLYDKVILISQGTVDNKQPEKLIIPALEALKNKNYLLIVTTGNVRTSQLRKAYLQPNILIEDFVDFDYVLPYTDVFICNGGYGSILLSISNGVPILAAGLHEGKNEINARIGYFKAGINMKTERPTPSQIARDVEKILSDNTYRHNVRKLQAEFKAYHPLALVEQYIEDGMPVASAGYAGAPVN